MSSIKFNSIHEYLDQVFKDIAPSKELITLAKKDYWRAYNTDLKRRQRKEYTTVHLRFSKEEVKAHTNFFKKTKNLNQELRNIVLNYLQGNELESTKLNTALIEQQVFLISEYIEEWKEENEIDSEKLQQLESCILAIEKALTDDH